MNKSKLNFFIITFFSIFIIIASIIAVNLIRVKDDDELKLNLPETLGVWWWDDSLSTNYLDFARINSVDEIYFCTSKFNEETSSFIQKANEFNIKVYVLWGEKEWINDKSNLDSKIIDYNLFQQTYPDSCFEGIHLDVEPHQFSDFNDTNLKRKEYLQKYVSFVSKVVAENPNIKFDFDIPFWLDDEIEFNRLTKPVYQHIIDFSNRVFVMSYRDTATKIVSVAQDELNYAKEKNKQIFVSAEIYSNEGDNVSFQEEGKEIMYEEINKISTLITNQSLGVSIHHIKSWFDLKNR